MNKNLDVDLQKCLAARKALDYVRPGMRLGLGSGSTANHFIDLLGKRVQDGLDVVCVPTSEATKIRAGRLSIPLTTLDKTPHLDMTIDGADEIDPNLSLIKGGGGAHLREKIISTASEQMIVIADASKYVTSLGKFPLPLEVIRFGTRAIMLHLEKRIQDIGLEVDFVHREDAEGKPVISDNGNYIFDGYFKTIKDPVTLEDAINGVTGLVAHGLFIGIAYLAIIANPDGQVNILKRHN